MGLFSAVSEHVPFQMSSLTKRLLALDTSVYLFFVVKYHVPFQISCSSEGTPTLFTVVWFLSTVGEDMLSKI